MPEKDFFEVKEKARKYVSKANDILIIDKEIDIIVNDYETAKDTLGKITKKLEGLKSEEERTFQSKMVNDAISDAVVSIWSTLTQSYYGLMEDRYNDIIKIYENGTKESDTN